MKVISSVDWPAGKADLSARVAAFRANLANHAFTVDVPAPREDPLVEQLAAMADDKWDLRDPPPDIPSRPSPAHEWVGGAWIYSAQRAEELRIEEVKRRLVDIDIRTVRVLREWFAARQDAPQALKDREAESIAERAKL